MLREKYAKKLILSQGEQLQVRRGTGSCLGVKAIHRRFFMCRPTCVARARVVLSTVCDVIYTVQQHRRQGKQRAKDADRCIYLLRFSKKKIGFLVFGFSSERVAISSERCATPFFFFLQAATIVGAWRVLEFSALLAHVIPSHSSQAEGRLPALCDFRSFCRKRLPTCPFGCASCALSCMLA